MLWCNYVTTQPFTTYTPTVMWALLSALWAHSTMAAIIITYRGLRNTNTPNMRLTLTPTCLRLTSLALCFHSTNSHWPVSDSGVTFLKQENLHLLHKGCSNVLFFQVKKMCKWSKKLFEATDIVNVKKWNKNNIKKNHHSHSNTSNTVNLLR